MPFPPFQARLPESIAHADRTTRVGFADRFMTNSLQQIQGGQQIDFIDTERENDNRARQPRAPSSKASSKASSKSSSIQNPNLLASLNLLEIRLRSVGFAWRTDLRNRTSSTAGRLPDYASSVHRHAGCSWFLRYGDLHFGFARVRCQPSGTLTVRAKITAFSRVRRNNIHHTGGHGNCFPSKVSSTAGRPVPQNLWGHPHSPVPDDDCTIKHTGIRQCTLPTPQNKR